MIISWTDALWLIANGLLAVSSLMCLGKLVSRGTTLLATRLSYVVTPLGAMIAIAGFLQDRIHAIYLGELLEILGMLIISVRIYYFLSQEDNGKYGAYVGEERRRPPEDNHRMAMKPRRTMRS
jgi:hypothetical protein